MKHMNLFVAAGLLVVSAASFAGDAVVPTVQRVDEAVVKALEDRRVSLSDRNTAYSFSPFTCVRCHSGGPGSTAPVFYGNPDFAKDQWEPSGTGSTLKNFKWEDILEHDEDFYKIGASQAELLERSW